MKVTSVCTVELQLNMMSLPENGLKGTVVFYYFLSFFFFFYFLEFNLIIRCILVNKIKNILRFLFQFIVVEEVDNFALEI